LQLDHESFHTEALDLVGKALCYKGFKLYLVRFEDGHVDQFIFLGRFKLQAVLFKEAFLQFFELRVD